MGFSLQLQDVTVFGILFAIICLWLVNAKGNKNKGRSPPEPSGAWPVMGHLHLLGADKPLHRTFGAMADEYGPIFSIRLGLRTALVVSSSEVAKECYTTKDKALANRPRSLAVKLMGYDHAMFAFERHGPYWRDVRRLAMVELLSNRQHEMLKHVRDSEVKFSSKSSMGNGTLPWMVRHSEGIYRKMKGTARQLDQVIGRWVEEHRQKRLSGSINEAEQDFIHAMLSVIDDAQFSGHDHDHDTVIKATCLAQEELDFHVGRNQQVYESDIKKLVYLQAIIKETLRLYPAGPLALPHEAMEDCTIAGFDIQAGTRLLVNLWKLHRDPTIWSDPLEFQPERRMCPGISFALEILQLTLARLLHGFELGVVADSPLDMTEGVGLALPKATPLEVTLVPRLPSELYH
ncbi:Cytochrome P450 82C4 [Vitis vinifera]|uniref:Cytochrome P450 82C4 n=1 Tax=Vitis vinifera TaxID=29760 RepID=A0A438FEG7_VITVI|nr:Cytochrome P450 82C4 [Vitis vinifera]